MRAEITPVRIENVYGFFRHFQSFQNFVDGIGAAAHEIAVVFDHIFRIGLAVYGRTVFLCKADFLRKIEKFLHRFSAAGNVFFHFRDKCVHPKRHGSVEFFRAGNHAVCVGNFRPFDLIGYAQFIEEDAQIPCVV